MTASHAPSLRALVCALALLLVTGPMPTRPQTTNKPRTSDARIAVKPHHRFTKGRAALRIPFEVTDNLVYVRARVNDSEPLWFILDTGASATLIDDGVARQLGLSASRRESGTGTGGPIEVGMIDGVTLSVPGAEAFDQTVGTFPLGAFTPVAARRVGGILGYDFIKEFVLEIDYAARLLNLYEHASYEYKGRGQSIPLNFFNRKPNVRATLFVNDQQSFDGTFEIDTGGDGTLVVSAPFAKAHRLDELIRHRRIGNSGGAGGMVRSSDGRVAAVRVGRFTVARPIVTLIQAGAGEYATEKFDGVLGGEFFRRFKLIIDYSRNRVIFEPNAHFGEPVETDMSGLEFAAEGEDFRQFVVNEVIPGSPAAEAGFREEDVLVSLDGRAARSLTLEELRTLLRREGARRALTVKRGEEILKFRIRLRRLL